jgi:hypothetical protein
MVMQWIDQVAGVAYVCVRGPLTAFAEFLQAIERLITHPSWQAGMPIIEDLRELSGEPPPECLEDWRQYVAEREHALHGCRWAVVSRGNDPELASVLDTAGQYATTAAVTLRQFTNTVDAHAWLSQASVVSLALLACG